MRCSVQDFLYESVELGFSLGPYTWGSTCYLIDFSVLSLSFLDNAWINVGQPLVEFMQIEETLSQGIVCSFCI